MAGRLPLEVELVHFLRVLAPDQFRDELELLPELQDGLLEHRHLPRRPLLEDEAGGHWVHQDVQVALLVEVVHGVEVQLDGLLLFLGVGLVDVALGGDYLQDGLLFAAVGAQEGGQLVVLRGFAGLQHLVVEFCEVGARGLGDGWV